MSICYLEYSEWMGANSGGGKSEGDDAIIVLTGWSGVLHGAEF